MHLILSGTFWPAKMDLIILFNGDRHERAEKPLYFVLRCSFMVSFQLELLEKELIVLRIHGDRHERPEKPLYFVLRYTVQSVSFVRVDLEVVVPYFHSAGNL